MKERKKSNLEKIDRSLGDIFILMEGYRASSAVPAAFWPNYATRKLAKVVLLRSMGKSYKKIATIMGMKNKWSVISLLGRQMSALRDRQFCEKHWPIAENEDHKLRVAMLKFWIAKRFGTVKKRADTF